MLLLCPPAGALLLSSGIVVELTTRRLAVFGYTDFPLIGCPRAPGITVVAAIAVALGAVVVVWIAMVVVTAPEADGSRSSPNPASALVSVIVLMPTVRWPPVSRDINVPSSVTPGTPGCNIVPPHVSRAFP